MRECGEEHREGPGCGAGGGSMGFSICPSVLSSLTSSCAVHIICIHNLQAVESASSDSMANHFPFHTAVLALTPIPYIPKLIPIKQLPKLTRHISCRQRLITTNPCPDPPPALSSAFIRPTPHQTLPTSHQTTAPSTIVSQSFVERMLHEL